MIAYPLARAMGRPIARAMAGRDDFNQFMLFGASDTGVFLDPSVLASLYQDSAGTVPVTAPGQPVGRVLDQSGRANHATQSISAARPTYARHPAGGKRQLWTNTDFAGAVSGTPGTAPTGWTWGLTGGSSAVSADAGGNGSAITITTNTNRQYLTNATTIPVAANAVLVASVRCDVLSGSVQALQVFLFVGVPAGSVVSYRVNGVVVAGTSFLPITNNVLVEVILTNGATAGAVTNNRLGLGVTGNATGSIRFYRPQIELNTATNYQKATSIYDVTEAGFADTWYLSFDGVDDGMVTPTVIWGADEVTIVAAIRKASDAAEGWIAHSGVVGDNGSWQIGMPGGGSDKAFMISRGTVQAAAATSSATYAAPISMVVTASGDVSGDMVNLRLNGTQVGNVVTDQGTGNYLDRPVYIGRRLGTNLPFNGDIYALLVINRLLTPAELASAERWAADRCGVTLP